MMSSESLEGPTQKRARMANVSYPNFRPAGYDSDQEKQDDNVAVNDETPVLHIRSLTPKVVEVDIWTEMGRLGKVNKVFMIKQTGQALVEFDSIETASRVMEGTVSGSPITICGNPVQLSFSKSKKIVTPTSKDDDVERAEHNILLLSIHKVMHPITVDVIHTICKPYGEVARIVIFRKGGTQAMVEFVKIPDAVQAKKHLNGTFIYSNCCSLRVDFGKANKLLVKVNNQDTWDYTPEGPLNKEKEDQPRVLLPDPTAASGQQQPEMPPWGPGWGMGMPGGGPPGSGGNKGMLGVWGPPPPPTDKDDSESISTAAYGYGNSYGSGKYGSGFPESYGGGYGASSNDDYGGDGSLLGPPGGRGGPAGYGGPPGAGGPAGFMGGYFAQMQHMQAMMAGHSPSNGNEAPNCVLMMYGLSSVMNCDRLFNLVCLYGNVVRIKFLRTKSGAAMVQMSDSEGCVAVEDNLNEVSLLGHVLRIGTSKQAFLKVDSQVTNLSDGTPCIKDYADSKCNRFLDPKGGALKRYKPHNIVHYYNAPPGFGEEDMKQAIGENGAVFPDVIKVLGSRNGKNSSGLIQWVKQSDANDAVCLCNHMKLEETNSSVLPGKRPNTFTLKLCFSSVPFIG